MRQVKTIKLLNRLITAMAVFVFVSILTFGFLQMITGKGALAEEEILAEENINKPGQKHNIFGKSGNDNTNKQKAEIQNMNDFLTYYTGFWQEAVENGGYSIEGIGKVTAYAKAMGQTIETVQRQYSYLSYDSKGNFSELTGTHGAPVPVLNIDKSFLAQTYGIDGIIYEREALTGKNINVDSAGRLTGKYGGFSQYANAAAYRSRFGYDAGMLGTVIAQNTINLAKSTLDIRRTGFTAVLYMNAAGLTKQSIMTKNRAPAKNVPAYQLYKTIVEMDYYGNVISMSCEQEYSMTVDQFGGVSTRCEGTINYTVKTHDKKHTIIKAM